jgi:hypothetical protein
VFVWFFRNFLFCMYVVHCSLLSNATVIYDSSSSSPFVPYVSLRSLWPHTQQFLVFVAGLHLHLSDPHALRRSRRCGERRVRCLRRLAGRQRTLVHSSRSLNRTLTLFSSYLPTSFRTRASSPSSSARAGATARPSRKSSTHSLTYIAPSLPLFAFVLCFSRLFLVSIMRVRPGIQSNRDRRL